jgi:hypothetical protein
MDQEERRAHPEKNFLKMGVPQDKLAELYNTTLFGPKMILSCHKIIYCLMTVALKVVGNEN